ncbi:caspase-1-like [Toxorhynchites rutilus septentrionalis]|uniref:caspase-1-like n=1 Tax=Toxorhynchites rutilus septentrionalis TaxID=329112 RepID=UPI00247A9A3E|nr:caspase-1-like [Toxorhynchites rutilus septentrionalis]
MDPEDILESYAKDLLILPGNRKLDVVDAKPDEKRVQNEDCEPIVDEDTLPGEVPRRKGSLYLDTPASPTLKVYPMNGSRRGKVLIFNHVLFDDGYYSERIGTENDVKRLYATMPRLGFQERDIIVYDDYSFSDIQRTAIKLEFDEDLQDSDCLIVVILTHGEDGDYLMARDNKYHLYRFIENFTPTALKSMAGKPKLFIVQACRGNKIDRGVTLRAKSIQVSNSMDHVDSQTEIFVYPEFADLLIMMSSHHGHYSFRNETGSWMIQELCNVIENCDIDSSSIYDILTETSDAVSKRISNADGALNKKKQIPSFYSTLTKRLYFKASR